MKSQWDLAFQKLTLVKLAKVFHNEKEVFLSYRKYIYCVNTINIQLAKTLQYFVCFKYVNMSILFYLLYIMHRILKINLLKS